MYFRMVETLQTSLYQTVRVVPWAAQARRSCPVTFYSKPGLFYHYDLVPQSPS
jgi:hypothetical protein